MNANPEAAVIMAGDFNHVELKSVLPEFHKFIKFAILINNIADCNILDQVDCNIPGAYKAVAAPHFGMSDHNSVKPIPAYRPLMCGTKPTTRTIQVWTEGAS